MPRRNNSDEQRVSVWRRKTKSGAIMFSGNVPADQVSDFANLITTAENNQDALSFVLFLNHPGDKESDKHPDGSIIVKADDYARRQGGGGGGRGRKDDDDLPF